MEIFNDFTTSVKRAFTEIDKDWETYEGLVVCGTHNQIGVEEIIERIRYARENKVPALLICAGHQLGAIEYARNVLKIKNATSEEFGPGTFVVKKRLGGLKVGLHNGESWWSNYEVVIDWNIPSHFVSVAFHPEYNSRLDKPHPLLVKFLELCRKGK